MEDKILSVQAVEALLAWYDQYKRDLPWRHTKDPYRIWISEIMLQQTRVEAVKPYYARFMEALPSVRALAEVSEEKLLKLWEGLGYYSRARNLQKAAKKVMTVHDGKLPTAYSELLKLTGIGEYTAGAIASIAYDERVPAIDGNVLRVLSRICASYEDIMLPQTKRKWQTELLPVIPKRAGDFNQALIELGATVCVPNGEARCTVCPMAAYCEAYKKGIVNDLPIKSVKKPRKIEEKTVFLIIDGNRTVLHKRPSTGLLAGLYELPNAKGFLDESGALAYLRSIGFEPLRLHRIEDAKHIFTHIEWHMIAYAVRIAPDFDGEDESSGYRLIDNEDLRKNYAVPSAFSAYGGYLAGEKNVFLEV